MHQVKQPIPGVVYPSLARLKGFLRAGELREVTPVVSFERHAAHMDLASCNVGELGRHTDQLAAASLGFGLRSLVRVLFQCAKVDLGAKDGLVERSNGSVQ